MKFYQTVLLAIFTHVAFAAVVVYVYDYIKLNKVVLLENQIQVIEKEKEILEVEKQFILGNVDSLETLSVIQSGKMDSLVKKIAEIEKNVEVKQIEIDSLIAEDSTRVVELYRIALQNLGIIPNMGERLTLREIGFGVKYLTKVPQLELKINLQNKAYNESQNLVMTLDKTIVELKHLNKTEKRITEQSELQSDLYKAAYDNTQRFWYNRIVLSAGVGVSYLTNKSIEPSLFVGIGFNFWSNK